MNQTLERARLLARENPRQIRELGVVALVALAAGILFSITGWGEALLRPLSQALPLRGGIIFWLLFFAAGITVFALRRWRQAVGAERNLRAMVENAPVGVFQITPAGKFKLVNRALVEMLGYASVQELLESAGDAASPFCIEREIFARLLRAAAQENQILDMPLQMRRRDGAPIWCLANVRTVRDAQGALRILEGDVRDITAVRQAELTYRNLVDQSLEGISILQDRHYVFANRAAAAVYGITPEQLTALSPQDSLALVHPDDRDMVRARIRDRMAGKSIPARSIFQILRADGATRWLEGHGSLLEYRGAPAILLLTADVTERKHAQDEMQANMLRTSIRQDLSASLVRAGTDLDAVLNNLAHIVGSTLGDLCVIGLVSPDGECVEPTAFGHIRRERQAQVQKMIQGTRLPVSHFYLGQVITAGEPLLVSEIDARKRRILRRYAYREYLETYGIASYLVVPLRHGGRVLGAVHLLREEGGAAYSLDDQLLLQDLADRSALAIRNAQLVSQQQSDLQARGRAEEALRASLAQLDALRATSQEITARHELLPLLNSICERAARLVNAPSSGLYLCDTEAQLVRLAASYNTRRVLPHVALRYGEGAAGRVAATGKVVIIPDYATWEGRAAVFAPDDFSSVITVPMLWQEQVVGALTVTDVLGRTFSEQDMRLLALFAGQAAIAVTAAQLSGEDVARARARYLYAQGGDASAGIEAQEQTQRAFAGALRDATALLNRVTDYDRVLDGILETVERIVPYDTAAIFFRQGEMLRVARARGFAKYGLQEWINGFQLPLDLPKFRQMLKSANPLIIGDTRTHSGWVMTPETAWIRSHIAAPIRVGNETVGMICLDHTQVEAFHTEHGVRLTAFADLAAAALHNAELLREAERRAQQLSLLYDVGLTMNRVLDSRTQLEFLFQIAQRALHADRMSFFAYIPYENIVQFELGVQVPDPVRALLKAHPFSVRRGEGLVGWVARNRLPALLPDVMADERWVPLETRVRSALAVPVEHEHELRGVLQAASYSKNAFTAQDERMLILFGNQIAAAMELTRLFQAQARRGHELEMLRQANLLFTTTFDRDTLVSQILDYALRLVAADNAHFYFYENDRLEFGGNLWARGEPSQGSFQPRENGLTYTVARTGKLIVVDHVDTSPVYENWRWGGAIVGLPLRTADRIHAVMTIAYKQPHRFEPEELRALQLLVDQAAIAFENVRHYQETQVQLRDALLLHRAGEALTHTLALDEMVEHLADLFMQAVNVNACCISTLDVTRNNLQVILDRDPIAEIRVARGTQFAISEFAYLQEFVRVQNTLILHRNAPDLDPAIAAEMDRFAWQAVLILPLLAGDEIIGTVELADQHTPREFAPDTVRLAESLAHQAASALQNARLFTQVKHHAEELTLLNRLARRVSGARTPVELGEIIEQETRLLMPLEGFYFALYDAEKQQVHFQIFLDGANRLAPFTTELSPSLTRHVIQTQKSLRLNELAEAPPDNPPQLHGESAANTSWLGAPMRLGERVVGIITLQSEQTFAYSAADEQLLQTIADQVAVAVERVRDAS